MNTVVVSVRVEEVETGEEDACSCCGRSYDRSNPEPLYKVVGAHGTEEDETATQCLSCLTSGTKEDLVFVETPTPLRQKGGKKTSAKQEKKLATVLGGKAQPGSGALPFDWAKGDVRIKDVARIEAKFTRAKSYSVKLEDLKTIRLHCQGKEEPAFVVEFKEKDSDKAIETWALIPIEDYEELLRARQNR